MIDSLYLKWQYLARYNNWIAWNLFLAFIPLALSFYLFRRRFPSAQLQGAQGAGGVVSIDWPRSPLWWVALAAYVTFLPNAPYVLTDIIHLIQATWATPSVVIVTFFYIPLHTGAILLAFEAYVVSLINQGAYLRRLGWGRYILSVEALTHILCAIGIYLGRFIRLNSWDIVVAPRIESSPC